MPKPSQCKICGFDAELEADIEDHVKVYHEEIENGPKNTLSFTFCGQSCGTFGEILAHIKIEHKEAKKPPDETEDYDHLIPEERALLIKLRTMFEKIYAEEAPEV